METSSDVRNDVRSDVTVAMPLLQQVSSGYRLTTLASGQILLTPIVNKTMVQPRRLQQQPLPSSSLSSTPIESTPHMHAVLPSTSSTPVQDFQNRDQNVSSGSCTPSPTVAFPPLNDDSSSIVAGVSSSPLQENEQQPFPPLSCTPIFPEENDSLDVNVGRQIRHFSPFEILPIPQVPQTGPRPKSNRKLGSARNLTSDEELQKTKAAYEEKIAKEKRKQELALKRQQKNSNQQTANKNGKKNQLPLKVCLHFKMKLFYYFNS